MSKLARANVMRMKPYQPGKPVEEVQRELGLSEVIKLASNENPLGPSPKAVEAIKNALDTIHIYPDGAAFKLKRALSNHFSLPTDHFLAANGSDELIHLLGIAYLNEGDEVLIGDPSFVQYHAAAALNNAPLVRVPLTSEQRQDLPAIRNAITERTKLIYIANPNNPTGTLFTQKEYDAFLADLPSHALVVMDEAYFEFVDDPDYPDSLPSIQRHNVMILRTFSKAYGLAGMRVGYAIARPELLDPLERVREPFNVNSLAQLAAVAALEDTEHISRTVQMNSEGKRFFYQAFERMGLRYIPTEANFMLVDTGADGKAAFDALLHKGVIVRPCAGFGLPSFLRVSIGTMNENRKFISALEETLGVLSAKL